MRRFVSGIVLVFVLLTALHAAAGTLVFPPPDGARQCIDSFVPNTCATVQFWGGSFIASTAQGAGGASVYAGGQDFPYCTSPSAVWTFFGANATEASITIHNDAASQADGSDVNSQSISMEVTDGTNDDGSPNKITTTHPFPKGESVTLTPTGTAITQIKMTVVTSFGVTDWNNASWAVTGMTAKQPIPPEVTLKISRNADGTHSAIIDYTFPGQSQPEGRSVSLYLLAAGKEPGKTYFTRTGLDISGEIVWPLDSLDRDRTLRAVAEACDAMSDAEASLSDCGQCKGPATAVGGPVRLFDGVMTYMERDPLPTTIGSEFRRERLSSDCSGTRRNAKRPALLRP